MEHRSIDAYDLPSRVAAYDADMNLMHPNRHKMIEIALEILPQPRDGEFTALELGGGTGAFTKAFLETFPNARVISIDGAATMVELARERLGPLARRVDFRVADFRDLDAVISQAESGAVVFSSYALHHLEPEEKLTVIGRTVDFLIPGGWFINADVIVADNAAMEARIQELRVAGIVRRAAGRHDRFRDFKSTRRFLDELEAREGDRILTLREDLEILRQAGLPGATVLWCELREAVCGGQKL